MGSVGDELRRGRILYTDSIGCFEVEMHLSSVTAGTGSRIYLGGTALIRMSRVVSSVLLDCLPVMFGYSRERQYQGNRLF